MRAIIIIDDQARALLEQLELRALRDKNHGPREDSEIVSQVHRAFHYVVTRWLQEMGCDTVRK